MDARERALLEAIRAAPDDDEPRLVWADHVGGERGELVVLQCQLARGGLSLEETLARRRRERALLAAHGAAWAGLEGPALVEHHAFRRGFVDAVTVDARTLVAQGSELAARLPLVRSLRVTGLAGNVRQVPGPAPVGDVTAERVAAVLGSPVVERVDAITFVEPMLHAGDAIAPRFESRADAVLAALARAPRSTPLRGLGIEEAAVDARALERVIASDLASTLEALELEAPASVGAPTWLPLLAAAPRLRSLTCWVARGNEAVIAALPALERLAIGLVDVPLRALAQHPPLAGLRALRLWGRGLDLAELAAFRQLEELSTALEAPAGLSAIELPALRRLHLTPYLPEHVVWLLQKYGPQLELLALSRRTPTHALDRCRPLLAGELLHGYPLRYL